MRFLREGVPQQERFAQAQPHPPGGEAVCVRALRPPVQASRQFAQPCHLSPLQHDREPNGVRLRPLRQSVPYKRKATVAPPHSHRTQALQVSALSRCLRSTRSAEAARPSPHRGKVSRLRPLQRHIHLCRQTQVAREETPRRSRLHLLLVR